MNVFRIRFPLLGASLLLLIGAIWAGLLRLGWSWPVFLPALPMTHGPLMVSGFFGTLIGLERAVALGRRWMYIGPGLSALGGILLVAGAPVLIGASFFVAASLILMAVFIVILRQQWVNYTQVMALGALSWLIGNLLWALGWPVFLVVYWWAGFLLLTIAGERLELARLLRPSRNARLALLASCALLLGGQLFALFSLAIGARIFAAGLLAFSLWLLRYDVARVTLRSTGLPRYIAIALLAGYVWLAASGFFGWINGAQSAGFFYDAFLHAIFLGFVFSMVFGHGPIILPAVLGRAATYHPAIYAPLFILHASLLLRLTADLLSAFTLRLWGGLLNGVAILLYFLLMLATLLSAGRERD
jgi:hypothetical protein